VLEKPTGGVAWTQFKTSTSLTDTQVPAFGFAGQISSNKTGAVAGGGFEYRVSQNFSVVGELLSYGFGTNTINVPDTGLGGVTFTTQFNNNDILIGTLGANWHF
jgi:opacity protein-like surface antigen